MMNLSRFLIFLPFFLLVACSKGPGALEGTWQVTGLLPMTIVYREEEEETMGIISHVTYKHEGNDVLVTYLDGMAKGTTVRITITGPDTASSGLGNLKRVR